MENKIRNVFVSHHHRDDSSVDDLTNMVKGKGYNFRNSSIRVNEKNKERIKENKVSERTIKRLLRMKMRWASQVIVIIGKNTHERPWVNWEIKTALQLGKPVIGVYEHGLKNKVEIPEELKNCSASIVGWQAESVIGALDGKVRFEYPDGTLWERQMGGNVVC